MDAPLGEAGITEIPNESAVLNSMQSNIGDKAGLYIFPGLGLGENASREEKSQAMKGMQQRIAANPSGILMYHPSRRQFAFSKALAVEFSTELLEALLVIWLVGQTQIASSAVVLLLYFWQEYWLPSQPTFRTGTGMVSRALTRPVTC
jgi:hypothetical protein